MKKRRASTATFLATLVAAIDLCSCRTTIAFSVGVIPFQKHCGRGILCSNQPFFLRHCQSTSALHASNPTDDNKGTDAQTTSPLCDLQTFLRMCDLVDSGGEAKTAIQSSKCMLNGNVETRRAKKLFPGDKVTFGESYDIDVLTEVNKRGYVYKPKVKKVKPLPKVIDADGTLEFGGRFRSEEWRAERKAKKADRKRMNRDEYK